MNINNPIDEQWVRRMQEMILLPIDNDRRSAFEAEIAQADDSVKQEWLTYLHEEERLRLAVLDVPSSPLMKQYLLSIPDESQQTPRVLKQVIFSCAAVLILAVLGLSGWYAWHHSITEQNLQTLALLAMNDHVDEVRLDVKTHDKSFLEQEMRTVLPFDISLPDLGNQYALVGGRKCVLGTHPVLYSRWMNSAGEYTLFQFQPSDFLLPATMKRTLVQPKGPATVRHPCEVLVWAQDNTGYVLVADSGAMLDDIPIQ